MPLFDIIMTRDVTESCAMVIEAPSREAAVAAAFKRAKADNDLVWEADDTPLDPEIYATNCEKIEDA